MYSTKFDFSSNPSTFMHIDLNSCFATIEQQANPLLRGKPIVVAAYDSPGGCIVAPSIEAKQLGIKVGMRVKDGKVICPSLTVLTPDPDKYRSVHMALRKILVEYTNDFTPRSIDEFVLQMAGYPCLVANSMQQIAREIKKRIKSEIGEWLTVSIGIAPNRFLAKLASNLHKPDGLDEINKDNFLEIYKRLKLTDLSGVKTRNAARLNSVGIFSVLGFYKASVRKLRAAFRSINADYWFLRLRGHEIDGAEFSRRSFGNSYALPKPLKTPTELSPILSKLVTKTGARLRRAGYAAQGVHVSILYRDWTHWHKGLSLERALFDSRDIYRTAFRILCQSPNQNRKPTRELAVSCFNLKKLSSSQLDLFTDIEKKEQLVNSIDQINDQWGDFVIAPVRVFFAKQNVQDRIAFGGVRELRGNG
jgi:DNA polymerase-4